MEVLKTTDSIVFANDLNDLEEIITCGCGSDIWNFIKFDDEHGINALRVQIEELVEENKDLETENLSQSNEIISLQDDIFNATNKIEDLEKELKDVFVVDWDDECIPF